jgi:hypothetical protein
MTFYSPQPSRARRVCKQASADTFNFTSHIASSIYAVTFTKRVKPDATIFGSRCSRTVVGYRLDRVQALPLSRAKVSRLANGSPELVRSPARWSRNVRDTTGKTSGEMSRATVAQCPRNRQTAADTLSPDDRRDDSRDNLRYADAGHAVSAPETCETTRNLVEHRRRNGYATVHATSLKQLMGFSPSAFNRHS